MQVENLKDVITLVEKALEENDEEAQYQLGILYYEGKIVEKNDQKAARYMIKSAAQGNKNAQDILSKWFCLCLNVDDETTYLLQMYHEDNI